MRLKNIFITYIFLVILTSLSIFSQENDNTFLLSQNQNNIAKNNNSKNFRNGIIFDKKNISNKVFLNSQEADTSSTGNHISKIWNNGQNFIVKLTITQFKDRIIKLTLVNLLGKEVKEIYEGLPKDNDWEYTFPFYDIPNGVYLCVLSSSDYRDAKKIVISK